MSSVNTGARFSARAATALFEVGGDSRLKSCPKPSAYHVRLRLAASVPLHSGTFGQLNSRRESAIRAAIA